ncbi:MAG: zinc-binding alcohol dehydrogenase [Erythrobacter sp.]|uniref:zinc-dependent alcohol dehydrogenase n=1 Tax=Erythrobacter sp. TaxID=1042 RepID=UPI002620D7BC|nr:zinc-binding alcohol dehydrogenase [Erythrobacter sp.]MDJ0978405.1 zinc-binding alcohol dehydrogenase [Erythrobacter sp.]
MTSIASRTAWLEGPGDLVWRDEPLAAPGPGDVLCETLITAISPGTELAAWRGAPPLRPGNPFPRVQGYCNVAKVLEVGSGVEGLAPGDRVLTLQSHRSHFVCPASDVYVKLTYAMGAKDIATAYLFHLGYNAVLRSDVRAGSRVCVIGLGALGLTSVAMAKQAGAEVYAVSDHDHPRYLAEEEYGARGAFARAELETLRGEMEAGAHAVLLTTNSWANYRLALDIAAPNAVIACLGFPGREAPPGDFNPLSAEPFYTKQLRIEAVGMSPLENDNRGFTPFNLRDNLNYIARGMERGLPNAQPIISGVYPAAHLERAYRDLDARKDNAVTFLLDWTP